MVQTGDMGASGLGMNVVGLVARQLVRSPGKTAAGTATSWVESGQPHATVGPRSL